MNVRLLVLACVSLSVSACGASVAAHLDGAVSPEASQSCRSVREGDVRAPSVVRSGQSTPLATRVQPPDFHCSLRVESLGAHRHGLSACCQVSAVQPQEIIANWDDAPAPVVSEPTQESIVVGGSTVSVLRIPANVQCLDSGSRIETVTIEADNGLRVSGPRRVWARVTGTAMRCSGAPAALIEASGTNPVMLTPRDCSLTDCDGPQSPRPFTVWVSLGTFAPGTYSVFYSPGISQEFSVQ